MVRVSRAGIVHGALVLFAGALVVRAADVQLVQGGMWAARARQEHAASAATAAPRGAILDATGLPLVQSHDVGQLSVAPHEVRDVAAVTRALAAAGIPTPWIDRALDRRRTWVVIPIHLMPAAAARAARVPGIYSEIVAERGEATAGSGAGGVAEGVDVALDSALRGDTTRLALWRDGRGRIFTPPGGTARVARAGNAVVLTINHSLQDICEGALADAVTRMGASGGDIVVVDPRDGAILALASRRNDRPGGATALTEPFEPGSTLKPFVAARLIGLGRVAPTDMVDTHAGAITIAGRTIRDVHVGIPRMTLRDVIRWSSNIGIVQFAERLSPREEYEGLRDVGFGTPTGVPYPVEAAGTLREPRRWSPQSAASLAIGYEIAVTPLQLAMAYAAIANGGELLEPALIREIRASDGTVGYRHERRVVRRAMSPDVAAQMRDMLVDPVARGTAVEADLSTFVVAGKTGTARRVESGHAGPGYGAHAYTATFVGLFPARDPQYVILVKIDDPAGSIFAGKTAAPVSRVVLEAAIAARDAALDRGALARRDRGGWSDIEARTAVPPDPDSESAPRADTGSIGEGARAAGGADAAPDADTTLVLAGRPGVDGDDRHTDSGAGSARAVPDVHALPLRAAVHALHESGFRVQLDPSVAHGQTVPAAGSLTAPGAPVRLGAVP
jgi:cell division protein FtsI (penicillin-binding protein 3)